MTDDENISYEDMTKAALPIMVKGKWIRFWEKMDYGKTNCNLIVGGKGTGKSALCEALATHYAEQDKDSKILDFWGCYSEDTEVYTEQGWKLFKDVTKEDRILTWESRFNSLQFHHPLAIQVYDYDGELIQFGGKHSRYDLLVTGDHNMVVRKGFDSGKSLEFIKAWRIQESTSHYGRCLPFFLTRKFPSREYIDFDYFEVPHLETKSPRLSKIPIDNWLRFFAWYISEGNPHKIANNKEKRWYQHRVEICQKTSVAKCDEIRDAFRGIGLEPKQDHDKIYANSRDLYEYVRVFGKAEEKYLPRELQYFCPEKQKLFIETLLKGDGHGREYYTSSRKLADDVQELALRAGFNASILTHCPRKRFGKIRGREIKASFPAYRVFIHKDNRDTEILKPQVKTVHYKGKIYDVTVPNHTLFVRRNGKVVWSGNSKDNEGVSWCRSPYKEKVLFLIGDSVKVHSRWPTVKVSDFKLSSLKGYKVCVTVSAFYGSLLEQNRAVKTIMEVLWQRDSWDHLWCFIVRELANLIFSRLSIGEDQYKAKATTIFLLREMRHMGYALCGDSVKSKSVDADLRDLADYTFLKACGKEGLPRDLEWLYSMFKPFSIMRMPKDQFIVVSRYGTVGRGYFACPPWHKREGEKLFKLLNIDIEHTSAPDLDMKAGHISDGEHVRIVELRKTGLNGDPLSFNKLAVKSDRSLSTVYGIVVYHNNAVDTKGECDRCKRRNGSLVTTKV